VGDDTKLRVSGTIGLRRADCLQAVGDANLGILQGFFRDAQSGRRHRGHRGPAPPVFSAALITGARATSRRRTRSMRSTA
jgi:hypothetical protein